MTGRIEAFFIAPDEWDEIVRERDDLRAENERLRGGLQNALAALDWIFAAQQPLRDSWFAYRDELIQKAREALK